MPPAPKVLLAEDEVLLSMDEEMALAEEGFDVCSVTTAERAWAEFVRAVEEGHPFTVLSIDNNLAGKMKGEDLIRQIRSATALKAVRLTPVLMHSSDMAPPDLRNTPNFAHLSKGDPELYVRVVKTLAAQAEMGR
jgi:DNA-binding response OmpR family regulator